MLALSLLVLAALSVAACVASDDSESKAWFEPIRTPRSTSAPQAQTNQPTDDIFATTENTDILVSEGSPAHLTTTEADSKVTIDGILTVPSVNAAQVQKTTLESRKSPITAKLLDSATTTVRTTQTVTFDEILTLPTKTTTKTTTAAGTRKTTLENSKTPVSSNPTVITTAVGTTAETTTKPLPTAKITSRTSSTTTTTTTTATTGTIITPTTSIATTTFIPATQSSTTLGTSTKETATTPKTSSAAEDIAESTTKTSLSSSSATTTTETSAKSSASPSKAASAKRTVAASTVASALEIEEPATLIDSEQAIDSTLKTTATTTEPQTTPKEFTTDVCVDRSEQCAFWLKTGECENREAFMRTNCPAKCGFCRPKGTELIDLLKQSIDFFSRQNITLDVSAQCIDTERNCAFWAGIGECSTNAAFMRPSCPVSCGLCGTDDDLFRNALSDNSGAFNRQFVTANGDTVILAPPPPSRASKRRPSGKRTGEAGRKRTRPDGIKVGDARREQNGRLDSSQRPERRLGAASASKETGRGSVAPISSASSSPFSFSPGEEASGNGGCSDAHQFCGFWAGIGECNSNGAWMRPNCRRSCGACGAGGIQPPPAQPPQRFDFPAPAQPQASAEKNASLSPFRAFGPNGTLASIGRQIGQLKPPDLGVTPEAPIPQPPAFPLGIRETSQESFKQQTSSGLLPDPGEFNVSFTTAFPIPDVVTAIAPILPWPDVFLGGKHLQVSPAPVNSPGRKVSPERFIPRKEGAKEEHRSRENVGALPVIQPPPQTEPKREELQFASFGRVPGPVPVNGFASPSRCSDVQSNNASQIAAIFKSEHLINPRENRQGGLNVDFVRNSATSQGCAPATNPNINCQQDLCYNLYFRTMDGTCNNLAHPEWGAAFTPYLRSLAATYDDGFGAPVGSRGSRPSARDITRQVLQSNQVVLSNDFNTLLMQWGQFLGHDMAKTSQPGVQSCPSCQDSAICNNIPVSPFDPAAGVFQGCVRMQRQHPVCGTNPREQLDENTAFLDGSIIYGASIADSNKLKDGGSGFLRMTFFGGRPVLPLTTNSDCRSEFGCQRAEFQSGDDRVNVFVALSALQIYMAREHNRLVNQLRGVNPQWDGERLYQEARKIVGAEIQAITFKEWLPKILGSSFGSVVGGHRGYDPTVNPSIGNHFTAAAFRFGHGMIAEFYSRLAPNGNQIPNGGISFLEGVQHAERLLREGGPDPIIRGMLLSPVKRPQRITPSATDRLFGNQDLSSLNIQRGRDQGIASYGAWRDFCKLPHAGTFEDLAATITTGQTRQQLVQLYGSPDNADLFVGGIVEDPVSGGMIGPTFACLIGDQFKRLRDGDRFFYQHPGVFTTEQLAELERTSLARILCDNGDDFQFVPQDTFKFMLIESFTPCQQVPGINLQAWKE